MRVKGLIYAWECNPVMNRGDREGNNETQFRLPVEFVSHKVYYFDEKWHKEMAIHFLKGLTVYLGTSKI